MTIARSSAAAAGHQGMLIITGGRDDKYKTLSSTELFTVPMDNGTLAVVYLSHTTAYNQ